MESLPKTITIDGPVAAGKSTVGRAVSEKLNYLMVDTGFFYRAVTFLALREGIDTKDNTRTGNIARTLIIKLEPEEGQTRIIANGDDITYNLRTPQVDKNVATISANQTVREALTPQMRKIAADHKVIMIGRDIGTVVLPDADLKLWLDATPEERAKRRCLEMENRGKPLPYNEVFEDILKRDKLDSERQSAPMKIPENAVIINTNNMTIPQVIDKVLEVIHNSNPPKK